MYPSAVVYCCCVLLCVVGCSFCEQVFRGRGLVGGRAPPPTIVKVYNTWMLAGGWGGASYIRFEEKHSTDEV